jgi:hypothetical protein
LIANMESSLPAQSRPKGLTGLRGCGEQFANSGDQAAEYTISKPVSRIRLPIDALLAADPGFCLAVVEDAA